MSLSKIPFVNILPFLLLLFFACAKDDSEAPNLEKPKPLGSKEIKVVIDKSLDFGDYRANTIMDSMAVGNPGEKLYAPEGIQSVVFFTDQESGEITALTPYDGTKSEVTVNVETVTEGVLTLAPMYSSLTAPQKKELLLKIKEDQSYMSMRLTVGEILSKREPIFSERPEFISKLLEFNSFILSEFYPDFRPEGGRLNLGQEDFASFVKGENGLTVFNQVSSYVHLEFRPRAGGNSQSQLLDPKPIYQLADSKISPVLMDDCYDVEINQSDPLVFQKNRDALAEKLAQAFIGIILSDFSGTGISGCINELSGVLSLELGMALSNLGSMTPLEILSSTTKTAADLLILAVKEEKCATLFFNKTAIAKMLASTSNLYVNLYKAAKFTYEVSEASAFAFAIVPSTRIDLKESLQLYKGKLVEACVRVVKDVELNAEYAAGENLLVKVKLDALSQYGDWKKSGFEISWSLPPSNGELGELFTSTNSDGLASVNWTLPNESNALVTLSAELKDKEGNHISGSPLTFQVKVKSEPEFGVFTDPRDGNVYKTVKIGSQTWFMENLRYEGGIPEVISQQAWNAIWNSGNPTGQPAWSYYYNDSNNDKVYGKLYNWYAVDTGGLCPTGWHIPTESDWKVLQDFLGGVMVAGGKMKSVSGWDAPNVNATNESGFTGLPGGRRSIGGDGFAYFGTIGSWWTSTSHPGYNDWEAWSISLRTANATAGTSRTPKVVGNSCRCLKD